MDSDEQRRRARPHGPSSPPDPPVPRLSGLLGPASIPSTAPPVGRVLIVDDDAALARALERTLASLGHAVTVRESGEAAVDWLVSEPCDLVLLDLVMPGLDGYAVLERIKADPALSSLAVVMISGLDDLDSVVRCIELGADDYLLKPAPRTLLRARVDASLEKKLARDRERRFRDRLADEADRADRLLRAIFPAAVIAELKETRGVRPRLHENVAVLFCDAVGFTPFCDRHSPDEVVDGLQRMVRVLDRVCDERGLEKIKTIGDAFLATAGLLSDEADPALRAVEAAAEMLALVPLAPPHFQVRIGVHLGPVMAGVVGHRQFQFDIWGDTVNTAARIQSASSPGAITVSRAVWEALDGRVAGRSLGVHDIRGKGALELFELTPLDPPAPG